MPLLAAATSPLLSMFYVLSHIKQDISIDRLASKICESPILYPFAFCCGADS
jgi:hypothetical protein